MNSKRVLTAIKMRPRLIFIISILYISSCQNSDNTKKSQFTTFNIEKSNIVSEIKLSDLSVLDIEYIPLETNEKSLIRRINDIKVDKEHFLAIYFNNILKFSIDGSFITKVGNIGKGPDEFESVTDANINPDTKEVYILTLRENKFYVYSENNEFVKSFSSPLGSSEFIFTEDGILCYSVNSGGNVTVSYNLINNTGEIIKSFPNQYPYERSGSMNVLKENIFYEFNNRLFKKEVYSDTIYLFEDQNFIPHMVIEQSENLLTPGAKSKQSFEEIHANFYIQRRLFEVGDFVFYKFLNGHTPDKRIIINAFIGSKNNKFNPVIIQNQGFKNDFDGGPDILPITIKDDNTLISWINAFELIAHVESEAFRNSTPKYPEKKKELEELAANLDENDNPVLMLVKLKE